MKILRLGCFLFAIAITCYQTASAESDGTRDNSSGPTKTALPPGASNSNRTGQESPRILLCTLMRSGNMKLVLVRDDGTEVKILTDNIPKDTYAAWSPDGKQIVFSSNDLNGSGLFLIDANGENFKRLTRGADSEAAWSPDGKTIVFTRNSGRGFGQLFTIRIERPDSGESTSQAAEHSATKYPVAKLSRGSAWDANAAWSPDGKTMAFDSDRSGSWRLYLMDADGGNVRDLSRSDNPGANMYPTWSPDGKRIAYTNSVDDGTRQLFAIDVDGKNKQQLTKSGDFNCYAAWSRDGKTIAYMSFPTRASKGDLVLMNPDGSKPQIICRNQGVGHNGRPAWKPSMTEAR